MVTDEHGFSGIEQDLVTLLRRFRAYAATAAREVDPQLEFGAYGLLIRIHELGEVRLSDLAEYFAVGKPTMSRQLAQLEERGLVERRANENDARSSFFALTGDASKKLARVRGRNRERFRSSMAEWEDHEVRELADSLKRLKERNPWE